MTILHRWTAVVVLALAMSASALPAQATSPHLPYTFFFTHYAMLGDPKHPTGVRYESTGHPFALAPDGSRLTVSGKGAWDRRSRRAVGGGQYTITNAAGAVTARGAWHVTHFISFKHLPGWWGIRGFKEEGWQGPPGSTSFSGILALKVRLDHQGDGVLRAMCIMPTVPNPGNKLGEGITLTGGKFKFTDFRKNAQGLEGVMFYAEASEHAGGYRAPRA
jgi:hypothetical protein